MKTSWSGLRGGREEAVVWGLQKSYYTIEKDDRESYSSLFSLNPVLRKRLFIIKGNCQQGRAS